MRLRSWAFYLILDKMSGPGQENDEKIRFISPSPHTPMKRKFGSLGEGFLPKTNLGENTPRGKWNMRSSLFFATTDFANPGPFFGIRKIDLPARHFQRRRHTPCAGAAAHGVCGLPFTSSPRR